MGQILASLAQDASNHQPGSDDPAYAAVTTDINWLNLVNAVLTGASDGGMDWNKAGSSISFVYR